MKEQCSTSDNMREYLYWDCNIWWENAKNSYAAPIHAQMQFVPTVTSPPITVDDSHEKSWKNWWKRCSSPRLRRKHLVIQCLSRWVKRTRLTAEPRNTFNFKIKIKLKPEVIGDWFQHSCVTESENFETPNFAVRFEVKTENYRSELYSSFKEKFAEKK